MRLRPPGARRTPGDGRCRSSGSVRARRPLLETLGEPYFVRTHTAMVKIRTVAMNVPISPIATTFLYVANTAHRRTIMSTTLTASALKAACSASPADFGLLRAANATKARPAMIPIEPPNRAEIAPCTPASQADSRLTAAVLRICNPNTGRKTCHTCNPAAKPKNFKGNPEDASTCCSAKSHGTTRDLPEPGPLDRVDQRFGRNVGV